MTTKRPNHKIYVDEHNLIHAIYDGDLDEESGMVMHTRGNTILQEFVKDGKDIKVLVDIRKMGKHAPTVRWLGQEKNKDMPIKKVAIILPENDPYTVKIVQIAVERSHHKHAMTYFKTEEDAISWLSESDIK